MIVWTHSSTIWMHYLLHLTIRILFQTIIERFFPMHCRDQFLQFLKNKMEEKRILILGFAREGQSTYTILRSLLPTQEFIIADHHVPSDQLIVNSVKNDPYVTVIFGEEYLQAVDHVDLVIKTPGISPWLSEVRTAQEHGVVFTSQTDLFFQFFKDQIIAVTGTKGKSTCSSIIDQVLRSVGKKAILLGNIGTPCFDVLGVIDRDTWIVYETSSHQAFSLSVSPHVGVWLNFYQEHLDYYPSLEEYRAAKAHLFSSQTADDYCLFNRADSAVAMSVEHTPAHRIPFSFGKHEESVVFVREGWIILSVNGKEERIIQTKDIPLLGKHNVLNCLPSVWITYVLAHASVEEIRDALSRIVPVAGRLEYVGSIRGVSFYDDALATIPQATIAALDAIDDVETLIVGGFDRGQDFTQLAKRIATSPIRTLLTLPTTGEKIGFLVKSLKDSITIIPIDSMDEAVTKALAYTSSGKSVLLSAASPSFGLFTDYRDRSLKYSQALSSHA
ncbi:UDP-N-acetylmuramoyl-L-alanine--D-glutamate ligase [Candidatus Cerribacteria bacterium 'Amazon FNV 2010 28 9']|uniref:UDP-N-acetylmuramoylalanine--D-glutamate ligase n=1 Tax=Candidatus Cerribacteria bacterium 'Amazon FNV 2010 28 9' TaxID=2081795 RepID=A0A317JQ72_9BACT|nr:MAG: UDP-N-acetylmuramoyl-L-alanine--D-glutamate ligase [Candidatus Cerribacteria bacterium 'Amazon FNV 2010 28 9']